ncbi:hypothetical protein KR026_004277, partial [Drosophila bipectinata]
STRPDIAFAVSALSQYNTNFGKQHWMAAKRVLRYLKGTQNHGLFYKRSGQNLVGYADADWAANIDDRRSFTGFAFKFASAAISWESKKQRTVALSSTEAEYKALSDSSKETVHLRSFLSEVLGQLKTTLYSLYLLATPYNHKRTKHVDMRHHFIRELVEEGTISVNYISTTEMPGDLGPQNTTPVRHPWVYVQSISSLP